MKHFSLVIQSPPSLPPHLTESLNIKYYCDGWILTISCIDTTDQMLNKQEEELAGGSTEDSLSPLIDKVIRAQQ